MELALLILRFMQVISLDKVRGVQGVCPNPHKIVLLRSVTNTFPSIDIITSRYSGGIYNSKTIVIIAFLTVK